MGGGGGGGGGDSRKTNIQREFPKKGAGGLKGELGEKRQGGVFQGGGGWYPNAHYELGNNFNFDFNLLMPMSSLLTSNKKKYYVALDWQLIITFDVVTR